MEDKIKEYFNLNGYYLKIMLTNQEVSLISYNTILLDGIKYVKNINMDEIKANDKIKNITVSQLYELIIKKIEEKKFNITEDKNSIILSLFKGNSSNTNTDLQIILLKNHQHPKNEYEVILSNIILKLREENKIMRDEINQIKNTLSKINKGNELINTEVNFKNTHPKTEIKFRAQKPTYLNANIPEIQNSIKENSKDKQFKQNQDNKNDKNQNKAENNLNPKIDISSNLINKTHNQANQVTNSLTISSLSNLKYGQYPPVELSPNSFFKISGYGANTYNGIVRNYNEDKIKVILDYKLQKTVYGPNGNVITPNISYFGIYDGHGGNKCSNFLQEKLDSFIFDSDFFPLYTLQAINEAYTKAENEFKLIAFDSKNGKLLDKSGSCSVSVLIIDEWCFVTYLGDSRGLYSYDSGNQLFQITRDHKPNDPIEKNRIEKAGGSVYKDDRVKINGQKVHMKEENLAPGVTFPYRVHPGNIAVIN